MSAVLSFHALPRRTRSDLEGCLDSLCPTLFFKLVLNAAAASALIPWQQVRPAQEREEEPAVQDGARCFFLNLLSSVTLILIPTNVCALWSLSEMDCRNKLEILSPRPSGALCQIVGSLLFLNHRAQQTISCRTSTALFATSCSIVIASFIFFKIKM